MIHEILGINYYVIGPSLCLLMTGVFLLISDLTFKLKPRYQSVVVIVGLLITGLLIYLKYGEFVKLGISSHFSSMILLDEFSLFGDFLLYIIVNY